MEREEKQMQKRLSDRVADCGAGGGYYMANRTSDEEIGQI